MMTRSVSAGEACHAGVIIRIKELLKNKIESLKSCNRTACLCLQYMDMVDILQKFLSAKRTGNYVLHLDEISEMLPFITAFGQKLYAKSVRLYVQRMRQ